MRRLLSLRPARFLLYVTDFSFQKSTIFVPLASMIVRIWNLSTIKLFDFRTFLVSFTHAAYKERRKPWSSI